MRAITTISNGPPSLTSPTAPTPLLLLTMPRGLALSVAQAYGRFVEAVERDLVAVVHAYTRDPLTDSLAELERLTRPKPRVRRLVDSHKSNADGASSYGLPSYTEARFAPPSWPREPASAPRQAPTPARARKGRDALRRKQRSRDFARTGRRSTAARGRL